MTVERSRIAFLTGLALLAAGRFDGRPAWADARLAVTVYKSPT